MPLIPVNSSNLAAVGYDDFAAILRIRFRNGGIYDYFDVPYSVYLGLMYAPSKGRFHERRIRWAYPHERVA
ncbi:MAG TPA: KTSC domain-containing protein [Verrucomicrobiota bacterium]|nr:KTSC domain-containing protein [Verrucomicrobiota bacterium]